MRWASFSGISSALLLRPIRDNRDRIGLDVTVLVDLSGIHHLKTWELVIYKTVVNSRFTAELGRI
jgi:hypothetical protein